MIPSDTPPTGGRSVNARAGRFVDVIAADAAALRCSVTTGAGGERLIDMGAKAAGSLEA